MISFILSEYGFLSLLSLFALGAVGSAFLLKKDEIANAWQSFFAIAGSAWGLIFSSVAFFTRDISFAFNTSAFPLFSLSFHVDRLSAFFIFVISLIALFCSIYGVGYVKQYYKKYSIGALGVFYHLFIAGMLMVVSASNGLLFLLVWEIMSVASYFLVAYDHREKENTDAGFLYLVMTQIGTAFIILAFLLMYAFTGSLDFQSITSHVSSIPEFVKNIIFLAALIGFGTKAGIIPFHIWLPSAHPAAPSHVSALMSGVMIKTGIYMMIRVFFDILQPIPLWWGLTVLIVGSVSALLGVLYALTEHDIKRLLAYHSIENIGIILIGLGSSLVFVSMGNMTLALFGLGAALFHTLNHATFKSLLFLSAGSIIHETHTRNMEEYGGLIKYMPQTAFFFLIGSMAISALPPFNGFFSEWMTFQALLQGVFSSDISVKLVFVLAAGGLALTGGLALACFVKAFGAIFLARPRSKEVSHAKESVFSLSLGMGMLTALCVLFGVYSGYLAPLITNAGNDLYTFRMAQVAPMFYSGSNLMAPNSFGLVSAPILVTLLLLALFSLFVFIKFFGGKKERISPTWDCGTDLTPRMEITATGFARSIMLIFGGILRPSIQREVEYHDAETRYLPKSKAVSLGIQDIYRLYFYNPIMKLVAVLSSKIRMIQSGNINLYVFYIFAALAISLLITTL